MTMRLRTLFRDERGGPALEFALVAPILLTIVCSTIDLGYCFLARTTLDAAVKDGARISAASQESTEDARRLAFRALILQRMSAFRLPDGVTPTISTSVYHDFGSSTPEQYTDADGNGAYTPPGFNYPGDPFVDRNGNGVWDADAPIAGETMGGTGDVVSYHADFPLQRPFQIMPYVTGNSRSLLLSATALVRNEPVKTE